jgi:hypothetical protein
VIIQIHLALQKFLQLGVSGCGFQGSIQVMDQIAFSKLDALDGVHFDLGVKWINDEYFINAFFISSLVVGLLPRDKPLDGSVTNNHSALTRLSNSCGKSMVMCWVLIILQV